ncbi:expressed unknown protein [Seminavis robusta]|uniref:DUF6824 domain-containing protein n=1 Tax=Seminavis robusta TaxID=568900 RepID=A0A9N8H9T9_9STRA|nr:expressed unknown protein [Seminavis robusta]|eukprot:Sro292_g109620.1 n/a (384) ;mRNA; f:43001-44226
MMNSNPDDNHNPNHDEHVRNTSIALHESLDRKISAAPGAVDIRPHDVLCGRSKASFNHVGNRRFRSIVSGALDEYHQATSKWAKSMVATKLVGMINADGGRFLKQRKDSGEEWFELSTQEAKAKVSHAIRDAIAAKDKTKANKTAGAGTLMKRKKEEPSFGNSSTNKMMGQPPGGMGGIGNNLGGGNPMMPSLNQSQSHLSLSSMAQPMFPMGGPQSFGGASSNMVQDQIQHLRQQDFLRQPLPDLGSSQSFLHGLSGMGNTSMPQLSIHGQLSDHASSLQQHQQQASLQLSPQQMQQPLNDPTLAIASGSTRSLEMPMMTGVARAPARRRRTFPEESKHGRGSSSSDTEDGDNDFLSLIDTVLGPMGSPTGPRVKKDPPQEG